MILLFRLHTPNLQKLAFSEHTAYLQNSYVNQLCTPTRSSLMTGYYPFRTGTQASFNLKIVQVGQNYCQFFDFKEKLSLFNFCLNLS
jgi:hypothetical protein